MNQLHVVTVATESKYYFPYLIESCKKNGKELELLGMGKKWEGYNWRFTLMIDYLNTLPKEDIVCFVDGYDVLCTRDLNELVPKFKEIQKRTNCKIIVGDDSKNGKYTYFPSCFNKNINAGTYIGYVKDIIEVVTNIYTINSKNDSDDQHLMIQYCQKNPNIFYVDEPSELFLTLIYSLQEVDQYVEIKNGVLTYNNIQPFFIHAAGNGYLDTIITKLGYEYNGNIKDELFYDHYKKILYHTQNFIYMYFFYILFFISFLVVFYFYHKQMIRYLSKTVKQNIRIK